MPGNHASQVDYAGFSKENKLLELYLEAAAKITQTEFDRWSTQDQLAFLINAYNAWTIKLILGDYKTIESIKDLGGIFKSPWKKSFVLLFGKTVSLDEIEHELIRGSDRYRDVRIHFAVNCASIGCPALRNEAYIGAQLNAQLEEQTRRFLSDKSQNRLQNNVLELSSLFKWYAEDFEKGWQGVGDLGEFLGRYKNDLGLSQSQLIALRKGDMTIDYLDYDWKLNSLTP